MAYPVTLWAKIKADYETGNFSYPDLAEKYEISSNSVSARSEREGWKKGQLKEEIEKTIQQKMIERFAKLGTDKKIPVVVDKMLSATKPTIVNGFGEPVQRGEGEAQGFVAEIEDWNSRDKAVTQYAKLTGAYVTDKVQLEIVGVKIDL